MYRFFEYPLVKTDEELSKFYNQGSLDQHGSVQRLKTSLKLKRLGDATSFQQQDRVLDYGCGTGQLLLQLADKIDEGVGVDISSAAISDAPRRENLAFQVIQPGDPLPLEDGSFDKVILLDVLEHVRLPEEILQDCRRVTKQGGQLLIEVPFTGMLSELAAGEFHQDICVLRSCIPRKLVEVTGTRCAESQDLQLRSSKRHVAQSRWSPSDGRQSL